MRCLKYVLAWAVAGIFVAACSGGGDPSPADVFSDAVNSVVFIETDIFLGSGVVYDEDGHIVTNYHVIEDAEEVHILPHESESPLQAEVVGFDRRADLAVLHVPESSKHTLRPLRLASSADVHVGDTAMNIGYPLEGGTSSPVAQFNTGVISAKRRSVLDDVDLLQTDVVLNPGSSGGALLNSKGHLIGIPAFTITSGEGSWISLAISADDVRRIADDLIATGRREPKVETESLKGTSRDLDGILDSDGYRVYLSPGDELGIEVSSNGDVEVSLVDPFGFQLVSADDHAGAGTESISYEAVDEGFHAVAVTSFDFEVRYTLQSTRDLVSFVDDDDSQRAEVEAQYIGELNFDGDSDTYLLDLNEGDVVTITLRSWDFDAYLEVLMLEDLDSWADDDDSGIGLLGTDASLEYVAPASGTYWVIVESLGEEWYDTFVPGRGFYALGISGEGSTGASTTTAPPRPPRADVETPPARPSEAAPQGGVRAPSEFLTTFHHVTEMTFEFGAESNLRLRIEGDFQAPDRFSCATTFTMAGLTFGDELVIIGEDAWLNVGEGWEKVPADDRSVLETLDACAGSDRFWQDILGLEMPAPPDSRETVNSMPAGCYSLGDTIRDLGPVGLVPPDLRGISLDAFELCLAEDGDWPVAVNIHLSGEMQRLMEALDLPTDAVSGQADIRMQVDISRVNDPNIQVGTPD